MDKNEMIYPLFNLLTLMGLSPECEDLISMFGNEDGREICNIHSYLKKHFQLRKVRSIQEMVLGKHIYAVIQLSESNQIRWQRIIIGYWILENNEAKPKYIDGLKLSKIVNKPYKIYNVVPKPNKQDIYEECWENILKKDTMLEYGINFF